MSEKDYGEEEEQYCTQKIPVRIKSGSIHEDYISIETSGEPQKIPFASIDYVCLGIIEEKITSAEPPKSNMRKMVSGILMGKDSGKEKKIQDSARVTYLLDIYVKDCLAPYRIDASAINYKGLLNDVSYISAENFRNLINNICIRAMDSKFNKSLVSFLLKLREKPKSFVSREEFELASSNLRKKLEGEMDWGQLGFSNDEAAKPIDENQIEE